MFEKVGPLARSGGTVKTVILGLSNIKGKPNPVVRGLYPVMTPAGPMSSNKCDHGAGE